MFFFQKYPHMVYLFQITISYTFATNATKESEHDQLHFKCFFPLALSLSKGDLCHHGCEYILATMHCIKLS